LAPLSSFVLHGTARLNSGPHPARARADAELLLLHLLGKDKAWLMAHRDQELAPAKAVLYTQLLERRLVGEPIQYITGETEFYGLPFRITHDVLIPRPETEHLVEKVIALAARFTTSRIVDIGTGSGCIAVALAHHLPQARVTAIDLSAPALAIAEENARRNEVSIRFLQGDLLSPIAAERFDIIVSNPPYVPAADRATLSVEVRDFEPELALFAGPGPNSDGLEIYRNLIPSAFDVLNPGGLVVLEIGYGQSPAIAELLSRSGFQQIDFIPDLQGIPRVACAQRP